MDYKKNSITNKLFKFCIYLCIDEYMTAKKAENVECNIPTKGLD